MISDDIADEITRAARTVAAKWPGVLDEDDLVQDIWLRLLETPGYQDTLERMEPSDQRRAIQGLGHQIASRERSDYFHFTGNIRYGSDEVKRLLANDGLQVVDSIAALGSVWDSKEDQVSGSREPTHLVETRVDLHEGMKALQASHLRYALAITDRYFFGIEPTSGAEWSRLSRAIKTLTEHMNSARSARQVSHDGPGCRRVMSNQQSINHLHSETGQR